jgi:tripeptidyl-peptidase-1
MDADFGYSQYAHPEAFNDITEGNNDGCSSPDETTLWGFPAAAGWDPVTGLGYESQFLYIC